MRVLVVDDNDDARRALCAAVQATPGFALAGVAASGEGALLAAELAAPQLVLLDVRMPGRNGIETGAMIRRSRPDVHVVLLSASDYGDEENDGSPAVLRKDEMTPQRLTELWRRRSAAE